MTKQDQLSATKQIHLVLGSLQQKLPGEHYQIFEQLKQAITQLNAAIAAEIQPLSVEQLPKTPTAEALNGAAA